MKRTFVCCALLFGVGGLPAGQGQVLCWSQTGTVSGTFGNIWANLGDGGIQPGTLFTAMLIYDAGTAVSPTSPGSYPGAIRFASLTVGTTSFQFDLSKPGSDSRIDVIDTSTMTFEGAEGYFWFLDSPDAQNGLASLRMEGWMLSSNTSHFLSDALDIQNLPVSQFDVAHSMDLFGLSSVGGTSQELDLIVNAYSVTPVPEPGPFVLSGAAGLAALLARGYMRPRKDR